MKLRWKRDAAGLYSDANGRFGIWQDLRTKRWQVIDHSGGTTTSLGTFSALWKAKKAAQERTK